MLSVNCLYAQVPTEEGEASVKTAKDFYKQGDYRVAYQEYAKLLEIKDSSNVNNNFLAAECILKGTFEPKGNAIPYLRNIINESSAPDITPLMLAEAYHLNHQFDSAIYIASKFLEIAEDEYFIKMANRRIEMVNNAKELMDQPLNVVVENLGEDINSPEPDYYAFVEENEEFLLFSTRREKGNGGYIMEDGYKSADIFMVKEKRGQWHKAKPIGGMLTTIYDEEIIGMTSDAEVVFVNLDTYEISGEIQMSTKKGRSYQKPELLQGDINGDMVDVTACINSDLNMIYFASNREGGFGGFDIYKSKLLPDGTWGLAENLGPEINTEYDEYFPNLSNDGKTLRFASEGHKSMGGFDIFITSFDSINKQWQTPENLGYPINSVDDDFNISYTKDGRTAFITGLRDGGIGNLDIYSVTFSDIDERMSAIIGKVITMAPIDYNDYQVFNYYSVNGESKRVMAEFTPKDTSLWKLEKSEKKEVKPGMQYRCTVVMQKDGEEKRFSLDKAPLDDSTYVVVDVKTGMMPIKNYKPPSRSRPTETAVLIPEATIEVEDFETGELIGSYVPKPKTAKFILTLTPGKYNIVVNADGFKPLTRPYNVYGKGSFRHEINLDLELEYNGDYPPVHYSEIKDQQ